MLISRLSLFRFAAKKQVKQAGIILDPESFRNKGLTSRAIHWFRNVQTLTDMQRQMTDFHRNKSQTQLLNLNNKLIDVIQKKNLRDIDTMVNDQYFKVILVQIKKQIKSYLKNNQPIPTGFNLFPSTKAAIVQARSFTDTIVRLKSIDQWFQLIVEFENEEKKQKAYHVLERFYKQKEWKFIKFNL